MSEPDPDTVNDIFEIIASRKTREAKAVEIAKYFSGPVYAAYPTGTHQAIETVNIYGLVIGVDANGYASEINFPDGADIP